MKLIIFRHGQTAANKARVLQGVARHPLNSDGVKQANCLRQNLSENRQILDIILSSPAIRAKQTADIVANNKIPVVILEDLREVELGEFENQPKDKFYEEYGTIFGNITDTNDPGYLDSRIPGGESRREVAQRWENVKRHIKEHYSSLDTIGISTHGGFMWVAYQTQFNQTRKFDNCDYFEVEI